jgi:hypothetical protein
VLGLEDQADTLGLELLLQPAGDLAGEPLLQLKVAGKQVHHSRELRQP